MVAFVAALLVAGVVQWNGNRSVPAAFQYVLPNASGYVVTGALGDLWKQGPRHLSRVFSQAASVKGSAFANSMNDFLAARCIGWSDLSDLRKLGIDETRGAALSMVDSPGLVAVPILEPDRFVAFLERMFGHYVLTLKSDVPDGKVMTAIRIDSSESSGIAACADGKPVDLAAGSTLLLKQPAQSGEPQKQSVEIAVSRIGSGPWKIKLHCSAIFSDGSTAGCTCLASAGGRHVIDCSAESWELKRMVAKLTESGRLKAVSEPQLSTVVDFFLLEDSVAFITIDPEFAESAARTQRNFDFYRGDDSFRAVMHQLSGAAGPNGTIVGAFTSPILPFTGRTHFSISLGTQDLTARVLIPWQTLQSTFLEQLIAPAPAVKWTGALSSDAELRVNDPALGYYLRFLDDYIEETKVHLQRLGNFQAFVREIMSMEQVGAFRFGARGVRDGWPDLAMSLELTAAAAEDMLLKQRIRMRHSRDLEILVAAAKKFIAERPQEPLSETAQLLAHGYLKPEPGAMWDRYAIVRPLEGSMPTSWEGVFKAPADLQGSDFATAEYDVMVGGRRFHYVEPPITDNDLAYRTSSDRDRKVDEAALKSGRFRTAAYIDQSNGRLVVATDLDTLGNAVTSLLAATGSDADGDLAISKLSVLGDPQFLISQGLLYPDERLNNIIRDYLLDLEQYRSLKIHVEPLPTRQGISASILLSHE